MMTLQTREIVDYLKDGGLVAIQEWPGRDVLNVNVVSSRSSTFIGLRHLSDACDAGFIRRGDPSPYKRGTVTPFVLTEAGKMA